MAKQDVGVAGKGLDPHGHKAGGVRTLEVHVRQPAGLYLSRHVRLYAYSAACFGGHVAAQDVTEAAVARMMRRV